MGSADGIESGSRTYKTEDGDEYHKKGDQYYDTWGNPVSFNSVRGRILGGPCSNLTCFCSGSVFRDTSIIDDPLVCEWCAKERNLRAKAMFMRPPCVRVET